MSQGIGNPQVIGGGGGADLSDETPIVESGSGSAGTSEEASRADHVHPAAEASLSDPDLIRTAVVNLTAAEIVGNTAGTLGHASGVTLVAGVADKRIKLVDITIEYTAVTAAYTGGGNVGARFAAAGNLPVSGLAAAANTFAAAVRSTAALSCEESFSISGASDVRGEPLTLHSSAAFTQPGTAAGTAVVTVNYRLMDA